MTANIPKTANTVFRSTWAFLSPTEKDWAVYPSYSQKDHAAKLAMAENEKWLSASNGTRIFKISVIAGTILLGIALLTLAALNTAGVITLPQAVSTSLFGAGGLAEGLGLSNLIALIRRNQSDKGRGLPFCHNKPFHFVADMLTGTENEEDGMENVSLESPKTDVESNESSSASGEDHS